MKTTKVNGSSEQCTARQHANSEKRESSLHGETGLATQSAHQRCRYCDPTKRHGVVLLHTYLEIRVARKNVQALRSEGIGTDRMSGACTYTTVHMSHATLYLASIVASTPTQTQSSGLS